MTTPRLNLVVIRVADIDRAVVFYQTLGLTFQKHAHGSGPEHYASEVDGTVFEIYPATEKMPPTIAVRIGFSVGNVDATLAKLASLDGVQMVTAAQDSPWGRRAVVADRDGHRVELVQAAEN